MDNAELSRLTSTLLAAVTDAERLIRTQPNKCPPELREIIRHAREMHELLLEALLQHPTLSTATIRNVAETSGHAIDQLESLTIPRGAKH